MMHTRRNILGGIAVAGLVASAPELAFSARPAIGGHTPEPWFADSTLNLKQDLAAATAEEKYLALLWEREGCTYCDTLHAVNFQIPEIIAAGKAGFHTVQMDLWGDREFVDFDGESLDEAFLAEKYKVRTTPTILFFGSDAKLVFRMPGYAEPRLHMAVYQFVAEEGYKTASLREWIKTKYAEE